MTSISRRFFLNIGIAGSALVYSLGRGIADTTSLSDVGRVLFAPAQATVYRAGEIVTLNPSQPTAEAIAVVNGRILAIGNFADVTAALAGQPFTVDESFAEHTIVPGFVAQHDHPVLAALSMSSEILSIEDWVLPTCTVPAVKDKQDFLTRLSKAVDARANPDEPVLTWGYHPAFYGPLTRADLDGLGKPNPIIVWGRSCHEMILSSAAMEKGGVTPEFFEGFSASAKEQSNFDEGHFWEQGIFAVLPAIAPLAVDRNRFRAGLELTRDYMHAKGITIGNEPGGIFSKPVQDAVNEVFSSNDMPFRWSFIPDGKSIVAANDDDTKVIGDTENLVSWYTGMTSMAPNQIKLFADGAIYSQLMQVREPYLDGHEGAWMMDKSLFERAFRIYWDAGYHIHIHVNGDAGVDRVLDTLEANMRRNPRFGHRTVLVHFAVSDPDQVARIKNLGAIVSGNPYYVTALSDQYSEVGLGPKRADAMVRLGDLTRNGIRWSLHSDMPMAPADPLFLMWCAVTRLTASGRVADPDQRASIEDALRGVTIEAAYSLKLEDEIGTLEPGKRANMTILSQNPLTVEADAIRDIAVWGTVMEGRVLPAGAAAVKKASLEPASDPDADRDFAFAAIDHALQVTHSH